MLNFRFKFWEKLLILIALTLFIFSSYIYWTNFPLRNYLFGLPEEGKFMKVGTLGEKTGSTKRQVFGESEFKEITASTPVYDRDVIVTGSQSGATIKFENGGSAELGPNTMVRLTFLNQFTLDGINRYGKLDVVAGQVTGQAGNAKLVISSRDQVIEVKPKSAQTLHFKAPAPMPEPAIVPQIVTPSPLPSVSPSPSVSPVQFFTPEEADKVKILTPHKGEAFSIDPPAKLPLEKTVKMTWKMTPPEGVAVLSIYKVLQTGKKEILKKEVPASKGLGSFSWSSHEPGDFEWEIRGVDGKPLSIAENTQSKFKISPEFIGIAPLEPLVGGKSAKSNQLTEDLLQNFNILLRWQKYPTAQNYKIWLGSSPTKQLMERTTPKAEFAFNKDKIFTGQLFYRISAPLPSGFIAISDIQKFEFRFLPPVPVTPENHFVFSKRSLREEGNRILITWQKTNFTTGYEIEISTKPDFSVPFLKKAIKENYFVMQNPLDGTYYWRVRGFTKELSSPMSNSLQFTIGE